MSSHNDSTRLSNQGLTELSRKLIPDKGITSLDLSNIFGWFATMDWRTHGATRANRHQQQAVFFRIHCKNVRTWKSQYSCKQLWYLPYSVELSNLKELKTSRQSILHSRRDTKPSSAREYPPQQSTHRLTRKPRRSPHYSGSMLETYSQSPTLFSSNSYGATPMPGLKTLPEEISNLVNLSILWDPTSYTTFQNASHS